MSEKSPIAVFLADIHWRTNTPEYRKETVSFNEVIGAKLREVADYCRANGQVPAFCAGDIFDISRDFMSMWTFKKMMFEDFFRTEVYCVAGQHDRFHHNPSDKATSLNEILSCGGPFTGFGADTEGAVGQVFDEKAGAFARVYVYGAGWGDPIPKPKDKGAVNVLVLHKMLWHQKPVYPGQTEGNVAAEAKAFADLGYKIVFSGDNHRQFDTTIGGVRFHNLGGFTRTSVAFKNQRPCFSVLYRDLSIERIPVGEEDVFDLVRSDADKGREDVKDGFSEALAGSFEYGAKFREALEAIAETGKCNEVAFNENQRRLLRDIINSI